MSIVNLASNQNCKHKRDEEIFYCISVIFRKISMNKHVFLFYRNLWWF